MIYAIALKAAILTFCSKQEAEDEVINMQPSFISAGYEVIAIEGDRIIGNLVLTQVGPRLAPSPEA